MRSKDLDAVLPHITITVTEEAIIVDGARTAFINGAVSQNSLELAKRLEMVAKDLSDAVKAIKGHLVTADENGVPVQSGNRRLVIKRGTRSSPSWKNIALDLGEVDPRDKEAVDTLTEGHVSVSNTVKVEIE